MGRIVQSWLKLNLRNIKFTPEVKCRSKSTSTSVLIFEIRDEINACAPRARKAYIDERKEGRMQGGGKEKKKRKGKKLVKWNR